MDNNTKMRLNNLAIRCFRDTADLDYIHARLAFKHNLYPQFLWSSLQALEKYGKSMLLQNLIKGKSKSGKIIPSHNIMYSLEKFEKEFGVSLNLSKSVLSFIGRLDKRAQSRYLEVTDYSLNTDIVTLDRSVHQVRRYCQHFIRYDYMEKYELLSIKPKDEIHKLAVMLGKEDTFSDVNPVKIFGGRLEKILKDETDSARDALTYNNAFFYLKKQSKIPIDFFGFNSYTSQFELEPEIIDIAREYIFIPRQIRN